MKKISIVFSLLVLLSCRGSNQSQVRVALLADSASFPLLTIAEQRKTKVNWILQFASPEEIMALVMSNQVDAAEFDPLSFINMREMMGEGYALFPLHSRYGLFLSKDYPIELLSQATIAVDEYGMSGILLDLWFANRTPLRLDAHDSSLRYRLLQEGKVMAAVLSGSEFLMAQEAGFKLIQSGSPSDYIGLLGYFGAYNDSLFRSMLDDYSRGLSLFNQNLPYYTARYSDRIGLKIKDIPPFKSDLFYSSKFYNSMMLLYKMKNPSTTITSYEELFWLPSSIGNLIR